MINKSNLLALRNAIDDILADMTLEKQSAGKRLTKHNELVEQHRKNYISGTWKQPKQNKKLKKAS
jgi:hypothetical protein